MARHLILFIFVAIFGVFLVDLVDFGLEESFWIALNILSYFYKR